MHTGWQADLGLWAGQQLGTSESVFNLLALTSEQSFWNYNIHDFSVMQKYSLESQVAVHWKYAKKEPFASGNW